MIPGSNRIQSQLTVWFMRRTAHSGIRRVADLAAAIANDIGSVRVENQDRVAIARGKDFAGRSFILVGLSVLITKYTRHTTFINVQKIITRLAFPKTL